MENQDICRTHGPGREKQRPLIYALDSVGDVVSLPDALKRKNEKDTKYFCPGCGERVVPEGGTVIRSRDYYRRGHFNAVPESREEYSGPKRVSLAELVRDTVAESLRFSRDFDGVYTGVEFRSEFYKRPEGEWWAKSKFNADIVARRGGSDELDVILHIVEISLTPSCNELYPRIKEIADEQVPSRKRKYIRTGDDRVDLNKRVYQNIIVIKNENSYRSIGRNKAELPPTVHTFVKDLTSRICFFDPDSMLLYLASISDPEPVEDTPKENPSRVFNVEMKEMPYFSFNSRYIGKVHKDCVNWKKKTSVHISNWKLAVPILIDVDEDGEPVSVARSNGQLVWLFPD